MKRKISLFLILALLVFAAFPAGAVRAAYADSCTAGSGNIQENGEAESNADAIGKKLFPFGLKGSPRYDTDDDFSMIKVLITVGKVKSVQLKLHGGYYIENNMRSIVPDANMNCTLNISVSSGQVSVTKGNTVLYKGNSVVINRVNLNSSAGWAQLLTDGNEQNNGSKYLGNFKFSVNDKGFLEMINIVPTVHYLYGIVPYEMSESNEPEALIAQAIVSKTYAFAFPNYPKEEYVITDSFSYQGYRGYKAGYPKCMEACIAACGKLLTINNSPLLAFYGATDGGETDLPSNVFGSSGIDYAYEIKLDDPDFEYAESKCQTLEITYGMPPDNSKFAALLNDQISKELGHSAEIISIIDCNLHTPKHEDSIRNLTLMDVKMNILDGEEESEITVSFETALLKKKGIFTKNHKIYWGEQTKTGCNVYFCRWGHGLGLSQYGAQARALRGECCEAILSFYFSKFDLSSVKEKNPEEPFSYTQPIAAYGSVNVNSYVNLRSGPSTDFEIAAKIPAGTHLDIISETDGWIVCIANGMLGYVRGDYVNVLMFPSPENALAHYGDGKISGSPKMYASPSTYSNVLLTFGGGENITVENEIGSWYYIKYNGNHGFVLKSNVFVSVWNNIDLHEIYIEDPNPKLKPLPIP